MIVSFYEVREQLKEIYNKLSTNDLIKLVSIYKRLDICNNSLSFALEILEDRGENIYDHTIKHKATKLDRHA